MIRRIGTWLWSLLPCWHEWSVELPRPSLSMLPALEWRCRKCGKVMVEDLRPNPYG